MDIKRLKKELKVEGYNITRRKELSIIARKYFVGRLLFRLINFIRK
jgi:hypothetical protein